MLWQVGGRIGFSLTIKHSNGHSSGQSPKPQPKTVLHKRVAGKWLECRQSKAVLTTSRTVCVTALPSHTLGTLSDGDRAIISIPPHKELSAPPHPTVAKITRDGPAVKEEVTHLPLTLYSSQALGALLQELSFPEFAIKSMTEHKITGAEVLLVHTSELVDNRLRFPKIVIRKVLLLQASWRLFAWMNKSPLYGSMQQRTYLDFFSSLGLQESSGEWAAAFHLVDVDGDGTLSFAEFSKGSMLLVDILERALHGRPATRLQLQLLQPVLLQLLASFKLSPDGCIGDNPGDASGSPSLGKMLAQGMSGLGQPTVAPDSLVPLDAVERERWGEINVGMVAGAAAATSLLTLCWQLLGSRT